MILKFEIQALGKNHRDSKNGKLIKTEYIQNGETSFNHICKNIIFTFTLVIFNSAVNLIGWIEYFSPLSKAKRNDGSSSSLKILTANKIKGLVQ